MKCACARGFRKNVRNDSMYKYLVLNALSAHVYYYIFGWHCVSCDTSITCVCVSVCECVQIVVSACIDDKITHWTCGYCHTFDIEHEHMMYNNTSRFWDWNKLRRTFELLIGKFKIYNGDAISTARVQLCCSSRVEEILHFLSISHSPFLSLTLSLFSPQLTANAMCSTGAMWLSTLALSARLK